MFTLPSIKDVFRNAERYFTDTPAETKWLYLRRKMLERFSFPVPRQLWIGVTHRCQCDCVHCCLGPLLNKDRDELTLEEIREAVHTARRLGFLEVSYFGGEPLLRKDIVDLIRISRNAGLLTGIYTNGIQLTGEMVARLKEAGLFFCNVSLDSADPERHNALRRYRDCFEKAEEGIRRLVAAGVKVSIWTYVKKEDVQDAGLADLKAIVAMARRHGVYKVVVLFPMASGNWLCGAENLLSHEEREVARAIHEPPFVVLEFPREEAHCSAGKRMIYVTPKGDVSPCPTVPHFFGNIRKEPLDGILKKVNRDFVDSKVGGCGECVMNHQGFRECIGVPGEDPGAERKVQIKLVGGKKS